MKISQFVIFTFFVLCCSLPALAQKIAVQGTVKGVDDNMPIPGATVIVKGTTVGTSTDFDGVYTINAKIGDELVFSFLGMNSKTVKVTGKQLNVALTSNVESLSEVVVIGYGSVTKKELTGAVAQVKSEALEKISTSDLASALQGQAAGVNIVSSSTPGGSAEILIRGVTTMEDNTPLYVVDGIIQEGDPRIAPGDIETIDILKDAASTAIYGSRGATGVILITTKQGKAGSLLVRMDASYAIQHRNAAVPLMNSVEQTYFDLVTKRNTDGAFDDVSALSLQLMQQKTSFQNETDLNSIIFNNNVPTQNFNANISGGTKDITYNVSAGFFNQEGLQINSAFNRFNTRANTVYKKDKLRIQTSLGLVMEERDVPRNNLLSQAIVYNPTQNGLNLDTFDELEQGGDDVNRLGWVIESLRTEEVQKSVRTNASFRINYELFDGLDLSANTGLSTINSYNKIYVPYQEIVNTQGLLQSQPSNSYIRNSTNYRTSLSVEVGATYVKEMGEHKLTVGAFATTEKYKNEAFSAQRTGATNPDILVLDGATGDQSVSSGFDYIDTRIGTIGRVQYDYKSKYLFSSSIRMDGSSKFPSDNQWGYFPSVALAWNVSDEPFWKSLKGTINNFKIRTSYGSVGNDRINSYSFSPGITQNINYVGVNGTTGAEQSNLGSIQTSFVNELLKWETTTQTNFGVDFAFLKNKLTLSAEYYHSDKKDMLFPVFLPLSSGGGNNARVTLNVGNMVNDGAEVSVAYKGRTGKVNWNMSANFSTNTNEITKINGDNDFLLTDDFGLVSRAHDQSQVTALAVGHEAGAFFLWRTNGIIDTEEKLAEYQKINAGARMGDTRFIDQDGNFILDDDDRVYSGSGLPKYEIGYTFGANYKGFDFSMNWYAALGQEIMNGFDAWAYGFGRHKDQIYQWSEANPVTSIPAFRGDIRRHPNYLGYSDLWLEDGSYLRLRQVSLGYTLSKKIIEKLKVNRIRLYVSAQNPLTITKYSGYNPEVGGGISGRGLDKGTGPTSSQYLVGLQLNF